MATIGQERHERKLEEITRYCADEDLELIESENEHFKYIVRDMDGFTVCEGSLAEIEEYLNN